MKNKLTLKLRSQELLLRTGSLGCQSAALFTKYLPAVTERRSVCSQVSEPRARRHAAGHGRRIHLGPGVSPRHPGRAQRALPGEQLMEQQQLEVGNVNKKDCESCSAATTEWGEAAVVSAPTEVKTWDCVFVFCVEFIL